MSSTAGILNAGNFGHAVYNLAVNARIGGIVPMGDGVGNYGFLSGEFTSSSSVVKLPEAGKPYVPSYLSRSILAPLSSVERAFLDEQNLLQLHVDRAAENPLPVKSKRQRTKARKAALDTWQLATRLGQDGRREDAFFKSMEAGVRYLLIGHSQDLNDSRNVFQSAINYLDKLHPVTALLNELLLEVLERQLPMLRDDETMKPAEIRRERLRTAERWRNIMTEQNLDLTGDEFEFAAYHTAWYAYCAEIFYILEGSFSASSTYYMDQGNVEEAAKFYLRAAWATLQKEKLLGADWNSISNGLRGFRDNYSRDVNADVVGSGVMGNIERARGQADRLIAAAEFYLDVSSVSTDDSSGMDSIVFSTAGVACYLSTNDTSSEWWNTLDFEEQKKIADETLAGVRETGSAPDVDDMIFPPDEIQNQAMEVAREHGFRPVKQ